MLKVIRILDPDFGLVPSRTLDPIGFALAEVYILRVFLLICVTQVGKWSIFRHYYYRRFFEVRCCERHGRSSEISMCDAKI